MGRGEEIPAPSTAKTAGHGGTSVHLYNLLYQGNLMQKKNSGKEMPYSSLSAASLPPAGSLKNGTQRSFSSSPDSTILRHGTREPWCGHSDGTWEAIKQCNS